VQAVTRVVRSPSNSEIREPFDVPANVKKETLGNSTGPSCYLGLVWGWTLVTDDQPKEAQGFEQVVIILSHFPRVWPMNGEPFRHGPIFEDGPVFD
jgi:hypothetical protein